MRTPRSLSALAVATAIAIALLVLFSGSTPAATRSSAATAEPYRPEAAWKQIENLMTEGSYEEAAGVAARLREAARAAGDEANQTRALVQEVQLRSLDHQLGEAHEVLRQAEWPRNTTDRAILHLYAALLLDRYYDSRRWEIDRRERISRAEDEALDLEKATRSEIYAAALADLDAVWQRRAELSEVPLSRVYRYLIPNDYPAEVRGTLRDAASYQLAGLLADSSFWTVEEAQDLPRSELARLIEGTIPPPGPHPPTPSPTTPPALPGRGGISSSEGGGAPLPGREDGGAGEGTGVRDHGPADAEIHPLVRMAAVLGDLEAWRLERGERAGALEARLQRLSFLHPHFQKPEERIALREHLERTLSGFRDLSWSAMGRAMLADWIRQEEQPDALVRAHEIARLCLADWPDTPGSRRCEEILAEIEAPDFELKGMGSDGLDRRSLRVQHKNLAGLRFRAWAVDVPARLSSKQRQGLFPEDREVFGKKPVAEWRVDLPPTPDFQLHQTYVTPPIQRPGAYLIVATALDAPEEMTEQTSRATAGIILGDLVLSVQPGRQAGVATVLSGASGEPLPGIELRTCFSRGSIQTVVTGADGRARLPGCTDGYEVVLARRGEEVAVAYSNTPYEQPSAEGHTLFFTDRSVYRPQQKVFWKILAYRRSEDVPVLAPHREIQVRLMDAFGNEVDTAEVRTNAFGTAAGSFTLPPGRPLGSWTLASSLDGYASFRVEEYKRPTFEVTLDDPAEAVRLGQPATFSGQARYYFGLPVTEGSVRWRVVREPVWSGRWWHQDRGSHQERVVGSGTSPLEEGGAFRLTFTPSEDESAQESMGEDVTWRFRVEAEVTDANGETREAQRSFRLGRAAVEARILLPEGTDFLVAGRPWSPLAVLRTSLDGTPRPGEGTWTLSPLLQPTEALLPADQSVEEPVDETEGGGTVRTPGDQLRPRESPGYQPDAVLASWKGGEPLARGGAAHGKDGRAEIPLPKLAPGAYRLVYETVDEFGTPVEARRELIVAGPKTPLELPAILKVDRSEARPGGVIRLLAHSGLPDQPLFLEIYSRGNLRERRALRSGSDPSVLEIPVRPEDRGGLGFKLLGVRDHQLLGQTAQVFIPWDDRELSIELSTFRDKLRPGARETWTVTVKTPGGAPEGQTAEAAAAEILASMYDRSLDLFQEHRPADLLSLFPDRTTLWQDSWSLGEMPVFRSPHPPYRAPRPGFQGDQLRLPFGWRGGDWADHITTPATPEEAARLRKLFVVVTPSREEMAERRFATGATASSADLAVVPQAAPPPPPPPAPVAPAPGAAAAPGDAPVLRSDFAETAFWQPSLVTGPDGSARIEFTLPDSVTSWTFWLRAVTRDLRAGSLSRRVESVKELMVRPYLPRFLREGDRAELKVAVDNASAAAMSGEVAIDIVDPETGENLLADFGLSAATVRRPFTAAAGSGTTVTFPLEAPRRVGPVAFRVTATAPGESDGELRPVPVLPSRMHLAQSRSVALREPGRREMTFPDLAKDSDPTRIDEQLVVTVDAQLFQGVLAALPYLTDYPYECTEQTLNRFLGPAIVTSLFDRHPAVARMAEELAKRETRLETWDATDPNRKMALEETPWLQESRGGRSDLETGHPTIRVLDPRVARADRDAALAKLAKAQLPNGAFPWFPGGEASPYMTVYLLYGFAKAAEFGVEVPRGMVERGWRYLGEYVRTEEKDLFKRCECWQLLTLVNYAASLADPAVTAAALPKASRQRILELSDRHRIEMTPQLQAMFALTLHRMERKEEGRKILTALLNTSTTTPDEGTFWEHGKRGWRWYEDRIETHAFVLRAVQEVLPEEPRRHGLVQWLFLNKQMNHWDSTRSTAEVLYAVAHYLEKENQLGVRETATVRIGESRHDFVWEPDRYTGKENRIIVPGEEVGPEDATIVVEKDKPGFLFATTTWHFSTDELPKEESGDLFGVSRRWFRRVKNDRETVLQPLADGDVLAPGDEVEVHLTIRSRVAAEYVHLRDPRPAGLEPDGARSGWRWDLGLFWYEETRDSGTNFFFENLPAGEYTLKHRVRANLGGTFRVGPATLQSMYAPEHTAYSTGRVVRVGDSKP
jgi:hypothetical protein